MVWKIHTCHFGLFQLPVGGEEQLPGVCQAVIDQHHEQEYHPFDRLSLPGPYHRFR